MTIKTIALDMDGVLVDMMPYWLYLLNRYHGEKLKLEDMKERQVHKYCKNATEDEVYQYFNQPGFFRHLLPMQGAVESVKALISKGYEVIIVTTVRTRGHEDKLEWLKAHIPEIDTINNVYFAKRKDRIKADVFIDDHKKNLDEYKAANPNSLVICMDAPYNRRYQGIRAMNWAEAMNWIYTCETIHEDRRGRGRAFD